MDVGKGGRLISYGGGGRLSPVAGEFEVRPWKFMEGEYSGRPM
jgi:hypothetical protein